MIKTALAGAQFGIYKDEDCTEAYTDGKLETVTANNGYQQFIGLDAELTISKKLLHQADM